MRQCVVCVLVLLLARPCLAQEPTAPPPDAEPREALKIWGVANRHFAAGEYDEAAKLYRQVIAMEERTPNSHYSLACCLVHLDKPDEAIAELKRAADDGFYRADRIESMELWNNLRGRDDFKAAVDPITKRYEAMRARLSGYSKPIKLKGVRTVEGQPDDGLRWRLRMSEKTDAKTPQRLIVWLHPSGGSMNETAERLAPALAERGYALLVFTEKRWAGWTDADLAKLDATLKDVAKTPGVDVRRPILFGYSAGGQAALLLWRQQPTAYSGLVLDAAYPLDMATYLKTRKGKLQTLPQLDSDDASHPPMFVLVGDRDGGKRLWQQAQEQWKDDVPLTVEYVEGKGHTWLFGKAQVEALFTWLEALPDPVEPVAVDAPTEAPAD